MTGVARRPDRLLALTDEEREYYLLNRRVYGRIFAAVYGAVFPLRRLRREVVHSADLAPGARVLDVATGTGAQAFAFAETGRQVIGIDLSEAMLRVARRNNRFPQVTFQRADATDLPFGQGGFDATCISFALHEMPISVRERVVHEMARVTKRGGTVIIVDYALPRNRVARSLVFHLVRLYERDHYASFVTSDLEALLTSAGVDVLGRRSALRGLAMIVIGRRRRSDHGA